MRVKVGAVEISCLKADITRQPDMVAIANAANAQLAGGGGVDGAINRAAGPALVKASRELAPIKPGQAVITPAFDLPNDYVIHCLGPVYGQDEPAAQLLADCYRNALRLCEEQGIESIAFPAISTGVFGYPLEEAADVALRAVADAAGNLRQIKRVRFCLFNDEHQRVHAEVLAQLTG